MDATPPTISENDVCDYLGNHGIIADPGLINACQAAERLAVDWIDPERFDSPAVKQGLIMLASRLWRRRNSPAGVESIGELGAVYVSRNDPDLAMLLGLGNYRPPVVG